MSEQEIKFIPQGVRLSHSTMELIHTCERKFQLEKLLVTGKERDETADTTFGSAYGAAVQHYFVHQDKEQAIFELFMTFNWDIESEKKSLVKCINALEVSFPRVEQLLEEYDVVYFENKPATELSFCLLTDKPYYFVGYLDLVLRHKYTGKYIALDVKTTGLNLEILDPVYENSAQLVGYSIVVDAIAGEEQAEYDVMYFVCQVGQGYAPKVQVLTYTKTLLDRLNWFLSLGMDIEKLERMKELNFYPMRGSKCLTYNRPCKYFHVCQFHSLDIPKPEEPDENEYQFIYNLQDLIDNHVERITR